MVVHTELPRNWLVPRLGDDRDGARRLKLRPVTGGVETQLGDHLEGIVSAAERGAAPRARDSVDGELVLRGAAAVE